jgi:hypothetical protein
MRALRLPIALLILAATATAGTAQGLWTTRTAQPSMMDSVAQVAAVQRNAMRETAQVPMAASMGLIGVGLLGMGFVGTRRKA